MDLFPYLKIEAILSVFVIRPTILWVISLFIPGFSTNFFGAVVVVLAVSSLTPRWRQLFSKIGVMTRGSPEGYNLPKPESNKRKSNKYINEFWGFSLDLGHWYEPKELSTEKHPFFRQDRFPMQANIAIGTELGPSSWEKTSAFGTKFYLSKGYKILGEHHITVYDMDHYAISYMHEGRIPTKKYSVVFKHPRLKKYIEFAFTISVYGSIENFEKNIGEGDMLVKSFAWL
jgi:hypothetical protein